MRRPVIHARRLLSSLLPLVSLITLGCDVCSVSPKTASRYGIPVCADAPQNLDGGVAQPEEEGRRAWTINHELDIVLEPDNTTGSLVEPVLAPGTAGVLPNPPGINTFPATAARYTVEVQGNGCVEGHDPTAGQFFSYWAPAPNEQGAGVWLETICDLKERNGATPDELTAQYDAHLRACGAAAGWIRAGDVWRYQGPDNAQAFVLAQDHFFLCAAQRCAEMNTFGGRDADADGQNDSCDCSYTRRPPPTLLDRGCHIEGEAVAGWMECRPGEPEYTCTHRFASHGEWLNATLFGGAQNASSINGGAGADADYEASTIDYIFDDGIEPNCPPGANCNAARQARRGQLYDKFLCKRLIGRHFSEDIKCKQHPNPARRWPSYVSVAWEAEINPQAGNPPREFWHEVPTRRIFHQGGTRRYPDYMVETPSRTLLGEAKCYQPLEWNRNSLWMWYRAVSFVAQFSSYMAKVVQEGRGPAPHWAITYHYCSSVPSWLRHIMPAGYVLDGGRGNYEVRALDSGGRNFVNDPVWALDAQSIAINLYRCFVPGGIAEDGVDPAETCTSSWYDHWVGSE